MAFERQEKVLFKHCDPAGIVFYPRYFEMMNDCVEAFFEDVLGAPFHALHKTHGVPTAQIETRFVAPSRHGDTLTLTLFITRVGSSSASYRMTATCDAAVRFETMATLVFVNDAGKATPWPDELSLQLNSAKEDMP